MKNSYQLIAKFNYSNNIFLIILINNSKILYVIMENNRIRTNLSQKEFNIFDSVYKSLKINTNKSINLGIEKFENKEFQIFYDKTVKLYYWYQIVNDKKYEATEEDNIKLNFLFNNLPTVLYSENRDYEGENQKNSKFITRIARVGKKVLFVLVSATICLTNVANANVINNIINSIEDKVEEIQEAKEEMELLYYYVDDHEIEDREYNFDEIKASIESNPNLTESEKSFMYNLKFLFDDAHEYMDLNRILVRLNNLKIIYEKNARRGSVLGEYSHRENTIKIYNVESFEECNLAIWLHEFLHSLQAYGSSQLIQEISNELLTRETLRKLHDLKLVDDSRIYVNQFNDIYPEYGRGYTNQLQIEYILASVLNKEDLLKFQFYPNQEILANALIKIDEKSQNNITEQRMEEMAYGLIKNINNLSLSRSTNSSKSQEYQEIYDDIDYYYSIVHGKSIKENLKDNIIIYDTSYAELANIKNPQEYSNVVESDILVDMKINQEIGKITNIFVLPRTYLSDDHPNPVVFYGKKDIINQEMIEMSSFELTNELDEMYKKKVKDELSKSNVLEH